MHYNFVVKLELTHFFNAPSRKSSVKTIFHSAILHKRQFESLEYHTAGLGSTSFSRETPLSLVLNLGPLRDPMQRRTRSAPAMTALITKPDAMHLIHHSSKGCQKNAPKTALFSDTVPWLRGHLQQVGHHAMPMGSRMGEYWRDQCGENQMCHAQIFHPAHGSNSIYGHTTGQEKGSLH